MVKTPSLSVIVPALNEEMSLSSTISDLIKVLAGASIDWEIILVNDGSSDRTPSIAEQLAKDNPGVRLIHHDRPMGIGACFRDGIEKSTKEAVTWFPGDGENNPYELIKYLSLIEKVAIVVPFVVNRDVRPWARRLVSKLYLMIVNASFGTMFNYTTGNVIYRRNVFDVVKFKANGFIYQTECLVRSVRAGFTFAEVPVLLGRRNHGHSKILTFRSVMTQIFAFSRLFIDIYFTRNNRVKVDSVTNLHFPYQTGYIGILVW
jgi:glycosyltransferase involved in cell wall biosynthesis